MADRPMSRFDGIEKWILDDEKRPVRCRGMMSLLQWAQWYENPENRRVGETFTEFHHISTVFLGVNRQWGKGPPILFETMVFETAKTVFSNRDGTLREYDEEMDDQTWRYSTWSDAEAGHRATVKRVLKVEAAAAKAAARVGATLVKGTQEED